MTVESITYVADLAPANPAGTDDRAEGDDHLRGIKTALKNTFPGLAGRFNRFQSKSGSYTGVLGDSSSVLSFSVAATLSLDPAATLGNGWSCFVKAAGGIVTIDPNASETVNDGTTFVLPRGGLVLLMCDGAEFYANLVGELPGTLKDMAGTTLQPGYLACAGAAVSRTTYADLFAAIGTTWGVGDGSTTFNVPNFNRRTAVGSGGSGTATLGNAVGNTGGAETHTLVTGELAAHTHSTPAHTHTVTDPGHIHAVAVTSGGNQVFGGTPATAAPTGSTNTTESTTGISIPSSGGGTSGSAGSGTAHNNMQPSAVVLKMIKY